MPSLDPRLADPTLLSMAGLRVAHRKATSVPGRATLFHPLPDDPMQWLLTTFPTSFQNPRGERVPMAPHHEEFWRWLWALRPGHPARTFLAIWGRGGGKSSSLEVGAATVGKFGLRRYGLYICASQTQADDHVANVSSLFERAGVERALNRYGFSRGWRVNRLRTAEGFTLDAVGLDTAARGVRIDTDRPDLLLLDDLDDEHDSLLTIQKKIITLTRAVLPTGSDALAVIGVQNIPNLDGIFAQLADGRAEFLQDRYLSGPHPVLRELPETGWWVRETTPEGIPRMRIVAGTPTWVGQDREACSTLLTLIGPTAFLIECQHQTARLSGAMFQRQWFPIVHDYPHNARLVRWWDCAGTEEKVRNGLVVGDADWTVGLLVAERGGQYWIVDMQRARLSAKGVEDLILQTARLDGKAVEVWIGEEPGSSGKAVVADFQRRVLRGYAVYGKRETGSKIERAKIASAAAEAHNIAVVAGRWNADFLDPRGDLCLFPFGAHDDVVDALSGAVNVLSEELKQAGTW